MQTHSRSNFAFDMSQTDDFFIVPFVDSIAFLLPLCQHFSENGIVECDTLNKVKWIESDRSERATCSIIQNDWREKERRAARARIVDRKQKKIHIDNKIMAFCRWCWYTSACSEYIEWNEYFIGEKTHYSDFRKTDKKICVEMRKEREREDIDQIMYSNIPLTSLNCIGRKSVHQQWIRQNGMTQTYIKSIQSYQANHT